MSSSSTTGSRTPARVPGDEGGLIDFVTRAVDVRWSTEPGLIDVYFRAQKSSR